MINNNHNFNYFFYHFYHHYSWGAQQAPWLLHLPLQDLKDWQVALGNDGNLDVCVWFSFSPFGWLNCGNVFPSWWCSQCVTLSDGNVSFSFSPFAAIAVCATNLDCINICTFNVFLFVFNLLDMHKVLQFLWGIRFSPFHFKSCSGFKSAKRLSLF